jgi:hypothetical protein
MVYEQELPGLRQAMLRYRGLILVGSLFVVSVAPVLFVRIPAMIDYVNHLARMHLLVDAAAGRLNPAYVRRMINEEAILQAAFPEYRSRLYCEYIFSDPHNLSRFFQGSNAPWLARRSMDRVQLT